MMAPSHPRFAQHPEHITVPFEKVWNDNANADDLRPDSITVNLYRYKGDSSPMNIALPSSMSTIASSGLGLPENTVTA